MNCKKCGNEFEGNFCPECGTLATDEVPQELTQCPSCGNQRLEGSKFCANCGYNFEEPNQSVEVKSKPKKPRKKLTKKQLMTIIIPVVAVIVLIAIIVPSVIVSSNIFRVGKVNKINIGDTQAQVVKVLGEPYEKSDYRYEYYSNNYVKLAKQIDAYYNSDADFDDIDIDDFDEDDFEDLFDDDDKITKMEDELEKLVYKYIRVDFDRDGAVTSVFFDNEKCDSKEYQKVVKSYTLVTNQLVLYTATDIIYSTKFTDGSFYKGVAIKNYIASSDSKVELTWADEWKKDYSATITKIKQNPDIIAMDVCGDNAYYAIGSDGTLTILGSGAVTSALPSGSYNKIIIAEGITSINCKLFENSSYSTKVTSITIPSSMVSICDYAFSNYNSLTSVSFAEGSQLKSIGDSAFKYCGSLTSITIPNSVTSIGEEAFYYCSSLTSVSFAEGSQLKSIGDYAFYYCNLASITIPSSVTSIGQAFRDCGGLTSVSFEEGSQLKSIEDSAFAACNYLESITIPSGVTSIGDGAFSGCNSLESITIPSSVTRIGNEAFYACSSLTSITIPGSVTLIGQYAFERCSSLTIYCEIGEPTSVYGKPGGWYTGWNHSNCPVVWGCNNITTNADYDYIIYNDKVYLTKYKSAETVVIVPQTIDGKEVVSIGCIFSERSDLTSVTIPRGVTRIGDGAFSYCSSLTSITIPSSVTSIGGGAFWGCSGLTSIIIPSSVTSIGDGAFLGCSNLTSITIPSSVTSIGEEAFRDCSKLTIYCEAASKPSDWDSRWNYSNRPVVWGYDG